MQKDLKAVKTATLTTEVVDGFEVLHTNSVADTFRLYATITKRLVVQHLLFSPLESPCPALLPDIRPHANNCKHALLRHMLLLAALATAKLMPPECHFSK